MRFSRPVPWNMFGYVNNLGMMCLREFSQRTMLRIHVIAMLWLIVNMMLMGFRVMSKYEWDSSRPALLRTIANYYFILRYFITLGMCYLVGSRPAIYYWKSDRRSCPRHRLKIIPASLHDYVWDDSSIAISIWKTPNSKFIFTRNNLVNSSERQIVHGQ